MAKNYVQPGNVLTLIAPADVKSGDGVLVGKLFGVATYDAAAGAEVECGVTDVWELAKAAGALAQGATVYWDNTAKNVTATATGNSLIGAVTEAAAAGAATARVRLNGVSLA